MTNNRRIAKSKPTKALVTRAAVRQMIDSRMERKTFAAHLATALSTTGSVTYLTGLAQDDTLNGRTGDVIRPRKIDFRFLCSDTSTNTVRMVLFQDYMANGAIGAVTDVLSQADINAVYNPVYQVNKRFKILADLNLFSSTAGKQVSLAKKSLALSGEIRFTGTGATSASAGVGALGVVLITKSGTPTIDFTHSLYYTDG